MEPRTAASSVGARKVAPPSVERLSTVANSFGSPRRRGTRAKSHVSLRPAPHSPTTVK